VDDDDKGDGSAAAAEVARGLSAPSNRGDGRALLLWLLLWLLLLRLLLPWLLLLLLLRLQLLWLLLWLLLVALTPDGRKVPHATAGEGRGGAGGLSGPLGGTPCRTSAPIASRWPCTSERGGWALGL